LSTIRDVWYVPGTLHVLPSILALPEGRYELLLVSQRTMHLLNDYLAVDVCDLRHWALSFVQHGYLTPDWDDPEIPDIRQLVNRARLECISMTNPIADGLQAIAAALAGQAGCSCGGSQTAPAGGAQLLSCLAAIPDDSVVDEAGLSNDPEEQTPPEGFDTWEEYVVYKCQAAVWIWQRVDALASFMESQASQAPQIDAISGGLLGWAITGVFLLSPVAMVTIATSIFSILQLAGTALSEMSQFRTWWAAHKNEIVCSLYQSGAAADAITEMTGYLEDAVQSISWEGALIPVGSQLTELIGTVMGQLQENGLVNALFRLQASVYLGDVVCACAQEVWHFDADSEGWDFTDYSDTGNSESGVWSTAAPSDPGDSSIGGLKATAVRVGVAGACTGNWEYLFPLDRPTAHTGDVFTLDGYCDNSGATYYQLTIIYLDDTTDTYSRQNPTGWQANTVTVTAPNDGKLIKALQVTAGIGSAQTGTRHFAFDKAEYIPLS